MPNYPANPRMLVPRLYLQLGIFLDYYTGSFDDGGLSAHLRETLGFGKDDVLPGKNFDDTSNSTLKHEQVNHSLRYSHSFPPTYFNLFPQFSTMENWPPTLLIHGTDDSAVLVEESRFLAQKLRSAGIEVHIHELPGVEHSFDYGVGADEIYMNVFDDVTDFLSRCLTINDEI